MTENLIHIIGKLMLESGVKERQPGGVKYYSGYGRNVYDWELFFDALCLPYFAMGDLALNALGWFISEINGEGFVPRILRLEDASGRWAIFEDEEHCKPFLCQTMIALMRSGSKTTWFTKDHYARLRRYLDYWLTTLDRDDSGLSEWNSGPHSGCDTQFTRIGPWRSGYCEGVDLNCILYRELLAAEELASLLGLVEEAARARKEAHHKRERIQALLWDEQEGFFYDRDIRTGRKIAVKSAAAFLTLWAGVATEAQASALVYRHLANEAEFWTPYPIPSYARTEQDYTQRYIPPPGSNPVDLLGEGHANWCGGLWPHWNYLIIHGLVNYRYRELAAQIAANYHAAIVADPGWHEWYNAETGYGCGMHPFIAGATVLGAILPIELQLGYDPMAIGNPISQLNIDVVRRIL